MYVSIGNNEDIISYRLYIIWITIVFTFRFIEIMDELREEVRKPNH